VTRRNLLIAFGSSVSLLLVPALSQKASTPKVQDKNAIAEEHARQLVLLMDTDKNGKISKQEWMKFMEAEFDRLDKDKKGELDQLELRKSMVEITHTHTGK
jgi:Ca2+-binding EF-hand superfamily protein